MKEKTKKVLIGVVTASAYKSEQKQLINGIISRANELNADVAVFSNIYNTAKYHAHVIVENKIYDLIDSKKLDGIIVISESFISEKLVEDIKCKLKSRSDIPIISIGDVFPEYESIDSDTGEDITRITDHLIEIHGFTDIDMLTGPECYSHSHVRVNGYKEALISHGIAFDKSKVIFGNFWMNSGEELAMEYITGKRKMPEAVICANDYMAYGLCDTFLENNVSVPDDITVIGYEFVGERYSHAPILTTYCRNRRAVGRKAADKICSIINKTEPVNISLNGFMVYGNSCSCCIDNKLLFDELSSTRLEQFYNDMILTSSFDQMITACRSISDYISVIQQFAYLIRDIKGLYLCLYEDWFNSRYTKNNNTPIHNDTMTFYNIVCPYEYSSEPVFFNKYDLYPDIIPHNENGFAIYFCPIFFSGKDLGYFILQYDKPDGYDSLFRSWMKTAANALEFLRIKNDIQTLMEYNNLSSLHDSLTGLYNENGLRGELKHIANEKRDGEQVVFVIIRSELFANTDSISEQNVSVKIDLEIAEILKSTTDGKNKFCAKLGKSTYAYAAIGKYSDVDSKLISDNLDILIRNGRHYCENYEIDSIIICSECTDIQNFSFDNVIRSINETITKEIKAITDKMKNVYYQKFVHLRGILYRNPETDWETQKICCNLNLSNGYFRAIYKELFNVSFHQDVIQSKISYAKYLMISTTLSLHSIADKCGYDDYKYFLRQFKNLTGTTPNTYRNNFL